MNYTEMHQQLKPLFVQDTGTTVFPGTDIECCWSEFQSENSSLLAGERNQQMHINGILNTLVDDAIPENHTFTYPVFKSKSSSKNKQAILLLHGLNERSWSKYLMWAYYLALHTSRPVILFPIAFHMNRSPEAWGNPRAMATCLTARKQRLGEIPMSSFANVALSERLCEDPLRFFTSGQQSASDLVQLIHQLNQGEHPLFEKGTTTDVFAYSIGAFLAQILFIGNPDGLFGDARLFLFCGGAFFDQMDGVSKLIMDQQAFDRLRKFYIHEFDMEMKRSSTLAGSVNKTLIGQSFLSMLASQSLKSFRENAFQKMHSQVQAIALLNDKVIPAKGVMESLSPWINVEVMDFPYPYSHENPFPLTDKNSSDLVDQSFEKVFAKASAFLQ